MTLKGEDGPYLVSCFQEWAALQGTPADHLAGMQNSHLDTSSLLALTLPQGQTMMHTSNHESYASFFNLPQRVLSPQQGFVQPAVAGQTEGVC